MSCSSTCSVAKTVFSLFLALIKKYMYEICMYVIYFKTNIYSFIIPKRDFFVCLWFLFHFYDKIHIHTVYIKNCKYRYQNY